MQWTIKMKIVAMGIMAVLGLQVTVFATWSTSVRMERGIKEMAEAPASRIAADNLRISFRDLALDAMPSPAERLEGRFAADHLSSLEQQLSVIRSALKGASDGAPGETLMPVNAALSAMERSIVLDLPRALESDRADQDVPRVLALVKSTATQFDDALLALMPQPESPASPALDYLSEELRQLAQVSFITGLAGMLVLSVYMALLGVSITRPLSSLAADMQKIAEGQTDIEISALERLDEVGALAKELDRIRLALDARRR